MEVLDEQGRLFGIVNVVDLAVVMVVLAVVAGGVFLVVSSGDQSDSEELDPTVETNVTLVFTDAHPWTVEQLDSNGTVQTAESGDMVRIEERHVAGQNGRAVQGVFRATINGTSPYRPDQSVTLTGERANLKTQVATLGESSLAKERTPLSLTTTVPSAVAASVEEGTELTVAGQQVGTVTDVAVLDTAGGNTTLHLGIEMETVRIGSQRYVGTTPLAIGSELHIASAELAVTGHISRIGSTDPPADTSSDVAAVEAPPDRP